MASGATEAADGAMSGAVHGGPSLAARAVSGNPLAGRRPYESRMRTATASLSSGEIRLLALPRIFAAAMQWMGANGYQAHTTATARPDRALFTGKHPLARATTVVRVQKER